MLNKLSMLKELNHVIFFVPSTKNVDKKITDKEFNERVDKVATFLSQLAGGATITEGAGCWLHEGRLIKERVKLVETYNVLAKDIDIIKDFARQVKTEWTQASIMLVINDRAVFIE